MKSKYKNKMWSTFIVFCSMFVMLVTGSVYLGIWLSAPAGNPIKAELIVALGGDINQRGTMAAKLYKSGFASTILLTGMGDNMAPNYTFYTHPRTQWLVALGVPANAILFDDQAQNSHQEALTIAAIMKKHAWQKVLVVSDPPHMRRLDYAFKPVFNRAGLQYRLIASESASWRAERWWENARWRQFCLNEVVKLIYYTVAYNN